MPLYFFDISDGDLHLPDDEGTELQDFAAARGAALATLPEILRNATFEEDVRRLSVRVRDSRGGRLFVAELSLVAQSMAEAAE